MNAAQVAKTIAAFCTTLVGAVSALLASGKVTPLEVLLAIVTVIGATAAVYVVPNSPAAVANTPVVTPPVVTPPVTPPVGS